MIRVLACWLWLGAVSVPAMTCLAQDQPPTSRAAKSVNPGINDAFLNPNLDPSEFVKKFEVESREVFRHRFDLVEALGLKPGDRVADVGTGTGLFLPLMSEQVGAKGWVYAIDIAPNFLQRVARLQEARSLTNITPVLAGQNDIRMPPDSVDLAFICDVYHHFEFPADSLRSILKAVKPGGQLVLVDFERIPGVSRDWTLGHVRAGKEVFRSEIEEAGFEFIEQVEVAGLKENYCLRFRRP
ncbi:MAG: methyltransferase domain-containing protein [Planctomycetota bacterium]